MIDWDEVIAEFEVEKLTEEIVDDLFLQQVINGSVGTGVYGKP